jgi:hypothetical protein
MPAKQKLTKGDINRRVLAFTERALPELNRDTHQLEQELLQIWRDNRFENDAGLFTPAQIEVICAALNERVPSAQYAPDDIAACVFEALPHPTIIFQGDKSTWNRSFALRLERDNSWQGGFPVAKQLSVIRQMHSIIKKAQSLRVNVILFPLDGEIARLEIVSIPESNLDFAYLYPLGETIRDIAPATLMLLLFKLSGLAHKQISHLMDIPISRVDTASKNHKQVLLTLRAKLLSTPVPRCQEPAL